MVVYVGSHHMITLTHQIDGKLVGLRSGQTDGEVPAHGVDEAEG